MHSCSVSTSQSPINPPSAKRKLRRPSAVFDRHASLFSPSLPEYPPICNLQSSFSSYTPHPKYRVTFLPFRGQLLHRRIRRTRNARSRPGALGVPRKRRSFANPGLHNIRPSREYQRPYQTSQTFQPQPPSKLHRPHHRILSTASPPAILLNLTVELASPAV